MATYRYFILKDEGLLVVEGSYFNEYFYTIKFGNTYYLMERATGVKIALSSNYDDFKKNYEKIMVEYKDYLSKAGLYNTARYVTSRSLANDEKIYNYLGDRPDPFKNDVDFSSLEKWDLEKDGCLSSRSMVHLQDVLKDEQVQKEKEEAIRKKIELEKTAKKTTKQLKKLNKQLKKLNKNLGKYDEWEDMEMGMFDDD